MNEDWWFSLGQEECCIAFGTTASVRLLCWLGASRVFCAAAAAVLYKCAVTLGPLLGMELGPVDGPELGKLLGQALRLELGSDDGMDDRPLLGSNRMGAIFSSFLMKIVLQIVSQSPLHPQGQYV